MERAISNLLIALLIVMSAGCEGDKSSTDGFITVDVLKSNYPKRELILQDFMDVEYIPLETNDEFINQGLVHAVGKKYIIVTNYIDDGNIFVYDRTTGKAIRKINRRGQGPEEYISLIRTHRKIVLDEENNEMFVNDFLARKINVYDLEGNFKRSFRQKQEGNTQFYVNMFNYDGETLICYDEINEDVPFLIVSKHDGSIVKEIRTPYKEKIYFHQVLTTEEGKRGAFPDSYNSVIPFNGNWILFEPSSDTIYTLVPDSGLHPFIARTPSVVTMDPDVFVVLKVISNRYYFMETIENIFDFSKGQGFPKKYLVYDTEEKDFFKYTTYNGDYSTKKEVYMISIIPINREGEYWSSIDSHDLLNDYQQGRLKGKLKEVAAGLQEDANRVIMLLKPKQS